MMKNTKEGFGQTAVPTDKFFSVEFMYLFIYHNAIYKR